MHCTGYEKKSFVKRATTNVWVKPYGKQTKTHLFAT